MKKLVNSALAFVVLFTATSIVSCSNLKNEDWTPESGFTSLFNGNDLSAWCFRVKPVNGKSSPGKITDSFDGKVESNDEGRYSAKDGILTVNFPQGKERLFSQMWTVTEFPKNFVLKLEFRASPNADSGIYIRGRQLQCRDYSLVGPYKNLKHYKPQDWNQIEITVKDDIAYCTCNGEVLETALEIPDTGPIGLEGDRGQMEYRHIQFKKL
jgi:hypothetical protein